MGLLFDRAQKMSWNNVRFPINSLEIIGEARFKLHEYPHQDGGDLEKMGRKPYVIRVGAIFDQGILAYPNNYPAAIEAIASYAEAGKTARLVTPQAGSIDAFCTKWPRKWTADVRSGETMQLEFVEDQEVLDLDTFSSAPSLTTIGALYTKIVKWIALAPEVPPSLWDLLMNAVMAVLAMKDQLDLFIMGIEAKIQSVINIIGQIDKAITSPLAGPLVDACIGLASACASLVNDIAGGKIVVRTFKTPRRMTIADVSLILFQTTERGMELLQMNTIEDAFDIPPGTNIRYIVDTGNLAVS